MHIAYLIFRISFTRRP